MQARDTDDSVNEIAEPVNRLCNEIKLFDLCNLETCGHRSGTFCTDRDLLIRFEKIADVEERYSDGVDDEDSEEDEDGYSAGFDDEEYDDFGEPDQD
jgi:hypothetical protein